MPLLDPTGKALDGFFSALSDTAKKLPGRVTRIAHFGDSIIVSDYVSGTLRRKLQATFGDAGHGFVLIANAWPAYFHNDVSRYATAGFNVSRIVGPYAADGFYGWASFLSTSPNVLSRVCTAGAELLPQRLLASPAHLSTQRARSSFGREARPPALTVRPT